MRRMIGVIDVSGVIGVIGASALTRYSPSLEAQAEVPRSKSIEIQRYLNQEDKHDRKRQTLHHLEPAGRLLDGVWVRVVGRACGWSEDGWRGQRGSGAAGSMIVRMVELYGQYARLVRTKDASMAICNGVRTTTKHYRITPGRVGPQRVQQVRQEQSVARRLLVVVEEC
jgi:hypothetical protein